MTASFRYFEHPHAFSMWRDEPKRCDLCGRERAGYDAGAFHGARVVERICEDCLTSGRLEEWDLSTNEGDLAALRRQLHAVRPELSDAEREQLAHERTIELQCRTPALVTWQGWLWPAHCGDYCRYIKEVGQPELTQLAPDGDGVAFFAAHCPDVVDIEHAREVWEGIRPDVPLNARNAYPVGVYMFRCLVCGEHILMWDCD